MLLLETLSVKYLMMSIYLLDEIKDRFFGKIEWQWKEQITFGLGKTI